MARVGECRQVKRGRISPSSFRIEGRGRARRLEALDARCVCRRQRLNMLCLGLNRRRER